MRPLIVFSLISVLLLTFYIREGEAGPIHAVRSGVTTITSPIRFVGSAVAAPFNAIGNVFSNLTASQDTLDELKKQNEELTSKVAELSEAQKTAERLEGLVGLQSTYNKNSSSDTGSNKTRLCKSSKKIDCFDMEENNFQSAEKENQRLSDSV